MRLGAVALVVAFGAVSLGHGFWGGDILFDLAAGARRAGMGGAGVALPSPDALFTNPAGLAWIEAVRILSTYASVFDAAHLGAISASLPGLAAAGMVLDTGPIAPGLTFRTTGAVLGTGVRIGPLGIGLRTRLLHPVSPVSGVGGALDIALLLRGPLHIGAVWRGIAAQAPVASESWPSDLEIGLALPLRAPGVAASLSFDVAGIGSDLRYAVGGEFGLDWLLIRAGYSASGIAFGGTTGWGPLALDWSVILHPVLPATFRVSFALIL